jgi:hypothetical protein
VRVALPALVLLVFFTLLTPLAYSNTVEFTPGYPSDIPSTVEYPSGCGVVFGSESVIFECPAGLIHSGIVVTVNSTAYNALYVSYSENTGNITIVFYTWRGGNFDYYVEVYVPGNRRYAGRLAGDIQLELWEYDPVSNYTVYRRVTYTSQYKMYREWYIRVYRVRLLALPYVSLPPPPPGEEIRLPEWYDIPGWIALLIRVLITVARGLSSGLHVVALMIYYFVSVLPYIIAFIPVHIIFAFIHSPENGLKTIRFYLDIGRKIVDMFMKIVHVIISAVSAIIPF